MNGSSNMNNKVLLIAFYCEKSIGIKNIANYLIKNGFEPTICFVKTSPTDPTPISDKEVDLVRSILYKNNFLFAGLSILSSYTLSEVKKINDMLRKDFELPIVWGGIYPTLSPKECAKECDILVRGEGEVSIFKLAVALQKKENWKNLPSICYYNEKGEYIQNELEPLLQDLDLIGYSPLPDEKTYFIEGNQIFNGNVESIDLFSREWNSYELCIGRGCPFSCSYCSSSKLREIYKNKGLYFRHRSVDSVITEIKEAVKKNPDIKEIRFWDEVFPSDKSWVKEFSQRYKKEIGLRFVVWGHPLLIKEEEIGLLVDAGLRRIIVGFQSGSPNVRNNIFKRPETNEQIIEASRIMSLFPSLEVYYDLIICHILESMKELKETYDLCLKLHAPFGLQIHGLSFLPHTDIIQVLIDKGLYTSEELNVIFNASFYDNYRQWNGPAANYYAENNKKETWLALIFLTQFSAIRGKVLKLAKNPEKNKKKILKLKHIIENFSHAEQEILKRKYPPPSHYSAFFFMKLLTLVKLFLYDKGCQ